MFYNYTFYKNLLKVYSFSDNFAFLISLTVVVVAFNAMVLSLISFKYITKPLLITIFIISSFVAYFMDSYNVIIDSEMIRNSMQTNLRESLELFNYKLLLYFVFLGLVPSYIIFKTDIEYKSIKKELIIKAKVVSLTLAIILINLLIFSKYYTSFIREHKELRYRLNPIHWIYSVNKYISSFTKDKQVLKPIGLDATIIEEEKEDIKHNELVIFVLGETARADHFSLNGYNKETNPLLKKEGVLSLKNLTSCGTSTAYSVPCIFSIYNRTNYSYKKAKWTYNVLDILNNTKKVKILWRDNNSDSKGVALRVDYEDFKTPKKNKICIDGECRDEGMLIGLDEYIKKNKGKDILIVLHQMGSHGPAYYKRYPKSFEKFKPVCKTNQLEKCSKEEIINAYDNTILYTDYFLSKVIEFLKKYNNQNYETAMIYVSDHGESLGENGVYLHGLPYFMAPAEQTKVPAIIWLGDKIKKDVNITQVKQDIDKKLSHDSIFHTLLGAFEVNTSVYNKDLNLLKEE